MMADQIHFPQPSDEGRMTNFEWMPIRYRNVIAILKSILRGCLRLRKEREAHLDRRREGAAKLDTANRMGRGK